MAGKKWQNLLHQQCPMCGYNLEATKEKIPRYECTNDDCGFMISRSGIGDILMNENHIMHSFLNNDEKELLKTLRLII